MPRSFFKRHMPTREILSEYRLFRPFAALLSDPGLWALSRRSTAKAVGVGLFTAWLPIPFQTIVIVALVAFLRVNLPVAILASFISNPISMGPMMVLAYGLGNLMLQQPARTEDMDFGLALIWEEVGRVGLPLITGCLTLGIVTGVLAAVTINVLWRISLVRRFRTRRARRRLMGIRFRRRKRRKPDGDSA